MKKLLFFVLLFSISKTISLSAANSCKIIHPEQAIFDFQPGPEEKNDWYIINKDPNRVSALQQDYLSRKLLLANHQYPFSDKAIYAAEQSGEWKKLSCTVLKFFKSKAHSKELLAIVQVEYGDNFWNGQSSSTVLALSTDEYFVFPLSALESYEWPGGKIPKYLLNWNQLPDIHILGPQRAPRYQRMPFDARNKRLDPDTFCAASLESLRKFSGNDDFYQELLDMGSLKNTYHDLLDGGKRINLVEGSYDWKARAALVTYRAGSYTNADGRQIMVLVAPYAENDIIDDMGPYRGSTNHRDCYYFVDESSVDWIGQASDLGTMLARIIVASDNDFKGQEEPKRGYFERLSGFSSMGKLTADGYPFGLIQQDPDIYFLNSGRLNDQSSAEAAYQLAIHQLDTVNVKTYGRLTKENVKGNNTNSSDVNMKNEMYSITSNGHHYAVMPVYIRFSDDFYLCGIQVMKAD